MAGVADTWLPIVGYDNLLEQGTLASDGSDEENAADWYTADYWTSGAASGYIETDIGTSETCDYYGVAAHNINTKGGTTKLQYWTGAAFDDVPQSSYTPPDDNVYMVCFPSVSATKFRFVVSGLSAACSVGVVSLGDRLEFERGVTAGYTPARFGRDDSIYSAMTHDGHFVGRSLVRTGFSGSLDVQHITETWTRVHLDDFIVASRDQGWFLLWSPHHYPAEAAYCWTTATPRPAYEDVGRMRVSIAHQGVIA